ncbi:MAG: helix-turn-helix transcriptional regulator [Saprospiraceae bacterium]|nr:helix-turn-helix transcriptional regulator [Saprospiraceae bacterium]
MTKSLLARNLSKLRALNGFNQGGLAETLGVTRNMVASYESQNIQPKLDLLAKISALFRVSIDDLIGTEFNEENYESLTKRYLSGRKGPLSHGNEFVSQVDLDLSVIDEFIDRNTKIRKMVEGMKAFYNFKNQNLMLSAESQQLMYVLDHLIEANEQLLRELQKIK